MRNCRQAQKCSFRLFLEATKSEIINSDWSKPHCTGMFLRLTFSFSLTPKPPSRNFLDKHVLIIRRKQDKMFKMTAQQIDISLWKVSVLLMKMLTKRFSHFLPSLHLSAPAWQKNLLDSFFIRNCDGNLSQASLKIAFNQVIESFSR